MIYDVASQDELLRFAEHPDAASAVALTEDGTRAITGACARRDENRTCIQGELLLWDLTTGLEVRRYGTRGGQNLDGIALHPNEQVVVGSGCILTDNACTDPIMLGWSIADGEQVARLRGHTARITDAAFRADGTQLASVSLDDTLQLWDWESQQITRTIPLNTGGAWQVIYSQDGMQLVTAGQDGTVAVWNASTGEALWRLEGHTDAALAVAISQNGQVALSGGADGQVILWSLRTGAIIRRLVGHLDDVQGVAFDSTGLRAASVSGDGTLILWNIADGSIIFRLEGHASGVSSLLFSPDDQFIATGGADGDIIVWDVASAAEVRRLRGHTTAVNEMAFRLEGRSLISGAAGGTLILWRARDTLEDILNWAEDNRLLAELTCQQQVTYLLDESCATATSIAQGTPTPAR
ncbi:MAG: WD40 repeat domain-containing protein [Anaerolineae bacterium]|nr:WD40 repeat domain-containing protein [Anaerolineae bacterium]